MAENHHRYSSAAFYIYILFEKKMYLRTFRALFVVFESEKERNWTVAINCPCRCTSSCIPPFKPIPPPL